MENIKPKILFDNMVYDLLTKHEKQQKAEKLFIFKEAFDSENSTVLCETHGQNNLNGCSINTSDISTILIQTVGKYCDKYASDFLINWEYVQHTLSTPDIRNAIMHEETNSIIILFGIRESGVDHAEYILSTAQSHNYDTTHCENYYRKIYAVEISKNIDYESDINMILKDIKSPLLSLFYDRSKQFKHY